MLVVDLTLSSQIPAFLVDLSGEGSVLLEAVVPLSVQDIIDADIVKRRA